MALESLEQAAVLRLLDQIDLVPSELEIKERGKFNRKSDWVVIEDGHVVEMAVANVSDPAPIADLKQLEALRLWGGSFENLASLQGMPDLEQLTVTATPLRSIAGLDNCPQLKSLEIRETDLRSLSELAPLPALETLWVIGSELESLAGLADRKRLAELNVSDNHLTSLAATKGMPGLRRLLAANNLFSDLETLPELSHLEQLTLGGERLASLEGLPKLERLSELRLRESGLEEFPSVPGLPLLRLLDLGKSTRLGRLSQLNLPSLETLSIEETQVRDLSPLLSMPKLRVVQAEGAPIESIPAALEESNVAVELDPEIELRLTKLAMKAKIEGSLENFALGLPTGGGSMKHHRGTCTWSAGTFKQAKLHCDMKADELRGTMPVTLHSGNPLSPTSGGPNRVYVTIDLSVERGKVRAYVVTKIDYQALAETLTDIHPKSDKLIEIGGRKREAGDLLEGFSYAEAVPGNPGRVSGEAAIIAGEIVIWLEAIGGTAKGVHYTIEP